MRKRKRNKHPGEAYRVNELTTWDDDLQHYDMSPEAFLAEGLQTVLLQISKETRTAAKNLIVSIIDIDAELYMVSARHARYFVRRLH